MNGCRRLALDAIGLHFVIKLSSFLSIKKDYLSNNSVAPGGVDVTI